MAWVNVPQLEPGGPALVPGFREPGRALEQCRSVLDGVAVSSGGIQTHRVGELPPLGFVTEAIPHRTARDRRQLPHTGVFILHGSTQQVIHLVVTRKAECKNGGTASLRIDARGQPLQCAGRIGFRHGLDERQRVLVSQVPPIGVQEDRFAQPGATHASHCNSRRAAGPSGKAKWSRSGDNPLQ